MLSVPNPMYIKTVSSFLSKMVLDTFCPHWIVSLCSSGWLRLWLSKMKWCNVKWLHSGVSIPKVIWAGNQCWAIVLDRLTEWLTGHPSPPICLFSSPSPPVYLWYALIPSLIIRICVGCLDWPTECKHISEDMKMWFCECQNVSSVAVTSPFPPYTLIFNSFLSLLTILFHPTLSFLSAPLMWWMCLIDHELSKPSPILLTFTWNGIETHT